MERKWHGGSHLFIHFMSICITKLCWVVHRVFVLVYCNISVEWMINELLFVELLIC